MIEIPRHIRLDGENYVLEQLYDTKPKAKARQAELKSEGYKSVRIIENRDNRNKLYHAVYWMLE